MPTHLLDLPSDPAPASARQLPQQHADRHGTGVDSAMPGPEALQALMADAARHALLRRLAPVLRHEAAGPMQPIAMAASLLDRRLAAPAPDLEQVRDGVQRLVLYARKAVHSGLDLVTWLAPDASARRPLGETVQEALGLMATPLGFEGFQLESELAAPEATAMVPAATLRLLLPACLWSLTDQAKAPGRLRVAARRTGERVLLQLSLRPLAGGANAAQASPRREPAGRKLGWNELQALALSEGAGLQMVDEGLALSLPAGE